MEEHLPERNTTFPTGFLQVPVDRNWEDLVRIFQSLIYSISCVNYIIASA